MTIGELSQKTQTSPRSIRHYEANGLLAAGRSPNGYRQYGEEAVLTVTRIRWLIAAGLSVRTIRDILPCVTGAEHLQVTLCDRTRSLLQKEIDRIDGQMRELRASRKLLGDALHPPAASRKETRRKA